MPQKAIEDQKLVDFLAAHLVPDDAPLAIDLHDEADSTTKRKCTLMVLLEAQR